jgi:ribosomal protein S18 acetylase RimI-like enzyme
MRIRRAADADRPGIARLHAASWQDSYRSILPDALLDDELPAIMAERWAGQAVSPRDAVLVAEEEGVLRGFAASWDGEPVYIDNLHVAAAARSRGIGRLLLGETACHFLALGRAGALLHVVAANRRARAFYLALGGRPDGIEEKNLYGVPVMNERIVWPDLHILRERAFAR